MRAKQILENLSVEAQRMETDHEVQMARSDLYKAAKYAIELHQALKNVSEEQGLEGWVQAKITKASDYLSSVAHHLEYKMLDANSQAGMPDIEVAEESAPSEVINPTADSSPADLKAAIKYAQYMKNKMDTSNAKATYDAEIKQLMGWLKSKSTMRTEGTK
ncbi:hypothetical protein N9Z41_01575 [bacterium]|nr:hypothetical protein [bacterium]